MRHSSRVTGRPVATASAVQYAFVAPGRGTGYCCRVIATGSARVPPRLAVLCGSAPGSAGAFLRGQLCPRLLGQLPGPAARGSGAAASARSCGRAQGAAAAAPVAGVPPGPGYRRSAAPRARGGSAPPCSAPQRAGRDPDARPVRAARPADGWTEAGRLGVAWIKPRAAGRRPGATAFHWPRGSSSRAPPGAHPGADPRHQRTDRPPVVLRPGPGAFPLQYPGPGYTGRGVPPLRPLRAWRSGAGA